MVQIDLERFCWGNEAKMMNNEIGGFIFEKIRIRLLMNSHSMKLDNCFRKCSYNISLIKIGILNVK